MEMIYVMCVCVFMYNNRRQQKNYFLQQNLCAGQCFSHFVFPVFLLPSPETGLLAFFGIAVTVPVDCRRADGCGIKLLH